MANSISEIRVEAALNEQIKTNTNKTTTTNNTSKNANISTLKQQIVESKQTIDEASALKESNDSKIEDLEKEIESLKKQIIEEMEKAVNEGQAFTQEQEGHINDAITVTVAKYLNGEITKDELMQTLSSNLESSESEIASKLNNLIDGKSEFVDKIDAKISQICDLAKQNDDLSQKIKDEASKISSCQSQIATEQAKNTCDPIGFETNNAQFDFIIDRDNDGEFDNEQEFLGAQNGFEEMKALDTDGNGIVEGDELNSVKLIKTDKESGNQSFVTATEAGISKIDLASYEKTGYTQANGNEHIGKFNIDVQGKKIEGYQTLDSKDYLQANYGNAYGKSINSAVTFSKIDQKNNFISSEINTETSQVNNSARNATEKAKSYKNYKNLNTNNERKIVNIGISNIKTATENCIYNNNNLFETETSNLKSEAERDQELGINKDDNEDNKAQKYPSTIEFMSMAYAFQAQNIKKKTEVAA